MSSDIGTKQSLLRLMIILLEQPFRYTKKELAQKIGIKPLTITKHFTALGNAGFETTYHKSSYRYGFKEDKAYDQLKNLLHFTEAEQDFLNKAIDDFDKYDEQAKTALRIKKKLNSLYDYHKLGLEVLRRPHLQKINILEQAKNGKYRIYLVNYFSSNSNSIKDRLVEPLQVSPMDNMLYAYDVEKDKVSHFRLSRISKIKITNTPFSYNKPFHIGATDPFYIVDDKQVMVHLKFGVAAYNELVARFPLTKNYIRPDAFEDNLFDFQCKVNARFLGVTNFIFNVFHDNVHVLDPPELVEHLEYNLKKMLEKFRVDA